MSSAANTITIHVCVAWFSPDFIEISVNSPDNLLNSVLDYFKIQLITDKGYYLTMIHEGTEIRYDNVTGNINDRYFFLRPLISFYRELQTTTYVASQYKQDSIMKTFYNNINTDGYKYYRDVRGDGNCYFYAWLGCALENICVSQNYSNDLNSFFVKFFELNEKNVNDIFKYVIITNENKTTLKMDNKTKLKEVNDKIANFKTLVSDMTKQNNSNTINSNTINSKQLIHNIYAILNTEPSITSALVYFLRKISAFVFVKNFKQRPSIEPNFMEGHPYDVFIEKLLKDGENNFDIITSYFDEYFFDNNLKMGYGYIDNQNINIALSNNNISSSYVFPLILDGHWVMLYRPDSTDNDIYKLDTTMFNSIQYNNTQNDLNTSFTDNYKEEIKHEGEIKQLTKTFYDETDINKFKETWLNEDVLNAIYNSSTDENRSKLKLLLVEAIKRNKYSAIDFLKSRDINIDDVGEDNIDDVGEDIIDGLFTKDYAFGLNYYYNQMTASNLINENKNVNLDTLKTNTFSNLSQNNNLKKNSNNNNTNGSSSTVNGNSKNSSSSTSNSKLFYASFRVVGGNVTDVSMPAPSAQTSQFDPTNYNENSTYHLSYEKDPDGFVKHDSVKFPATIP